MSDKLPRVTAKDVIRVLEKLGFHLSRQSGSHRQYKHPVKKGLVTIAYHRLSDEVARGTLNSILKQAQIKEENK